MLKPVLSASVIGCVMLTSVPSIAQQNDQTVRGGSEQVGAQAIVAPNSGTVKCFNGTLVPWGPAPAYLIHTAGEALATCPDKKPDVPRIFTAVPRTTSGIKSPVMTASSSSATTDATGGSTNMEAGKAGQPAGEPRHPTDPLPPADANDGVPVLNCSNSANNPPQVNLSTGQPGWTLTGPAGAASIVPVSNVSWSAVAGAQWVGPSSAAAIGTYVYKTQVRINACPKGRAAQIAVIYRADNIGTLFVNGVQVQTQAGTYNYGFLPASQTTKTVVLPVGTSGVQTIELRVQNTSGPTGLAASVFVTR